MEKRDVLCVISLCSEGKSPGPSHDVAQGLLEQQGVYIPLLCLLPPSPPLGRNIFCNLLPLSKGDRLELDQLCLFPELKPYLHLDLSCPIKHFG